jgi:hypothetical protein
VSAAPRRLSSAETLVAVGAPLLAGALSLLLGADFNYDLRHYHFYGGWAFLHGRFDLDAAAAGVQSYFNPALDVVTYLGIRHLPPRLFGFLLGATQGLAIVIVHRIALRVLGGDPRGRGLALLAAALGGLGANALSLLGTTTGDALVALLVLLALLLALRNDRAGTLGAGVAAGAAAGLKLTMLVPALALAVAVAARGPERTGLRAVLRLAAAGLVGFLATGGFWSGRLLARFANPVFPLLNGFFRSPFFRLDNALEPRFVAHSWGDAFRVPLEMAMGWTSGLQEIRFREPRFLLLFVALVAWLVTRPRGGSLGREARFLLAFWLAGYLLWVYGLHYYRYALVLEALAPLGALVLLRATPRGGVLSIAGVVLVAVLLSRPVSWGRQPWSDDWFAVRLPAIDRIEESLVILAGERVSYVAPFFPEGTRFVGLTRRGSPGLDGLVAGRLLAHRGRTFLLPGAGGTPDDAVRFGLVPAATCLPLATREGRLCLYEVVRPPPTATGK